MPDFPKMYLADVATAEELNSDIFGVPMVIEHTGEYQYKANYYCQKPELKYSSYHKRVTSLLFVSGLIQRITPN